MSHPLAPYVVLAAVVVAAFLAVMGTLAWRRRRTRSLLFVTLAFWLFTAKGLTTGLDLRYDFLGHEVSELVSACFDLAILGLLAAPLVARRSG